MLLFFPHLEGRKIVHTRALLKAVRYNVARDSAIAVILSVEIYFNYSISNPIMQ
jgi:hypothetical protein